MAFSQAFTVSQSAATPEIVVLTDTSTGADASIVSRRAYFTDSQGNPVVPSGTSTTYVDWPLVDNPISLTLLTQDTAVYLTVQWLDVSNAVLYSSSNYYCLSQFNQQFFYYLIQQLGLQPAVLQDTTFKSNLEQYWVYIIGAQNAISLAEDLAASQNLLDLATNMMNNQQIYF